MKIRKLLIALVALLAVTSAAQAADTFPRLATYAISAPHDYYTATYQQQLARLHVAIVNIYPGWGGSQHTTMEDTVKKIKAINPNTRVFAYVIGESFQIPASSAWTSFEATIDAESWWLFTTGLNTTKVLSDFGNEYYVLNISTQARKNSSGQNFAQWFANFVATQLANPNPSLDGIFTDNVFWKPRRDGDWNLDGTTDSQNNATVQGWYRSGYRQYADALRKAMPAGKLLLANVADWGQTNAVLTEYNGAFNGGVLEQVIGASWSVENQGWAAMMASYRKTIAALAAPKYAIFEQLGAATDYQGMRYGLASCLMDDAYYAFNNSAKHNYGVTWFDEFDAKLGNSVSQPQTSAWQSGVYRRDFENGIVLVNPKGNGQREVTLEADVVKLKDRDGIILMRVKSAKRPTPPTGITTTPSN